MIIVDHISIQTSNFEKALEFYNEILGFVICVEPFIFKTRKLCYLDAGNIRIELYSTKNGSDVQYNNQRGGLDHIAFITDDLEKLINKLICCGIHVIKPPFSLKTKAGVSFLAFVEGPDGQEIELRQEKDQNDLV
jgi:catechol 2,3-dioxygenase-like lactoylglutathione lyase family enzyme